MTETTSLERRPGYSTGWIGLVFIGISLLVKPAICSGSSTPMSFMGSVPVSKAGIGSAMNDTTRQLGGALGVAVLGTVMNSRYLEGIEAVKTSLPQLPDELYQGISNSIQTAHMIAANPKVPAQFADTIRTTANQAFVSGMNEAMWIGAAIIALNAVIVMLVLPTHIRRSAERAAPASPRPMASRLEADGAAD